MTYDYRPLFTNRALSNLVGQISYNETASSRLGESVTVYNQKVFDDAVATYKDSGDFTPVDAAVDAQCRTNGVLRRRCRISNGERRSAVQ